MPKLGFVANSLSSSDCNGKQIKFCTIMKQILGLDRNVLDIYRAPNNTTETEDNQLNLRPDGHSNRQMSRVMRKPMFCICENKDTDQLRGDREADQRLCFRYIDSTIPLLSKSQISSLKPSSVAVQPGLCRTRWETRMLVFS